MPETAMSPAAPQRAARAPWPVFSFRLVIWLAVHGAAVYAVVTTPPTAQHLQLFGLMTFLILFGTTAGYHRYFAHRGFKTSRLVQFLFAVLGSFSLLGGPVMWASYHRFHHENSDLPTDIHTPRNGNGILWAHVGCYLWLPKYPRELAPVNDLKKYPELVAMDFLFILPTLGVGYLFYRLGGWPMTVWGSIASWLVAIQIYTGINSFSHTYGTRPFQTTDHSTNNPIVAILTLGEWHNNHHHDMRSVRHGLRWWEVDVAYYILFGMSKVGIIRDVYVCPDRPPAA